MQKIIFLISSLLLFSLVVIYFIICYQNNNDVFYYYFINKNKIPNNISNTLKLVKPNNNNRFIEYFNDIDNDNKISDNKISDNKIDDLSIKVINKMFPVKKNKKNNKFQFEEEMEGIKNYNNNKIKKRKKKNLVKRFQTDGYSSIRDGKM